MTDRRFNWGAPQRDPYAAALADRDQSRVAASLMTQEVTPDEAGRASRLARMSGLPVETVERNYADVEREQRVRIWRGALQNNTALSGWMANPRLLACLAQLLSSQLLRLLLG